MLLDLFFFFFHQPAWSLLGGKKFVKQKIKLVWPYTVVQKILFKRSSLILGAFLESMASESCHFKKDQSLLASTKGSIKALAVLGNHRELKYKLQQCLQPN